MHGVETVSRRVAGDAARAADAGDERGLMRWPADVGQRAGDGGHDAKISAAGAPDGLEVAFEMAGLKFGQRNRFRNRFESGQIGRSEEHTSELQSLRHLVCRLLLE